MRSRSTNILSQIIIFTFYNQQGDDVEDLDNNNDGDQTSNIFLLLRTSLIRVLFCVTIRKKDDLMNSRLIVLLAWAGGAGECFDDDG